MHTEDTYIDLRGAKYRSAKYVRELHTYTLTFRAGARQSGHPPHGKEACVKTRAYHNTHYVPVHNIAFDEKPAYGGDTRHR